MRKKKTCTEKVYPIPAGIDFKRMGKIIRESRMNIGMTQEKLAELIDVTPAFIGHIERGERSLSLVTLVKISQVLHISTDFLFGETDHSPEEVIIDEFQQLIAGHSLKTKKAVIDIIRTVIQYLD